MTVSGNLALQSGATYLVALNPATASFANVGGKTMLVASNAGDMRLRIASLKLKDGRGRELSFGNGLVGYALGHASMSWVLPNRAGGFGGGTIAITAETEKGPLDASAQWRGQ